MFKKFFILGRNSNTYDFCFPEKSSHSIVTEKPFLFPCTDYQKYEHGIYVIVLTEISGSRNFITTRFIKDIQVSLAFESEHPLFEIIYIIINNITKYKLYLPANWNLLNRYLNDLLLLPHPDPGVVFYIPSADFKASATKIVVPMKSRQKPYSVFVLSLQKQIMFEDWILIFENMLLERWIVFHSRHLNRVTNCIFAALTLIFPLEWVHLIFPCLSEDTVNCLGCPSPFIAGVHTCLIEKVIPFLNPGTLIVNIDEGVLNFVTTDTDDNSESDEKHIPRSLVNFILRCSHDYDLRLSAARKLINNDEDIKYLCRMIVKGFLQAIAVLLGKYKNCTIWDSSTNRYSIDNSLLVQSRGETIQPFLSEVIQSQMVYQFLDDKINQSSSHKEMSLTFAVDDIDDFEEACTAMSRWHPDHYTEVIANMASRSRRKINNFAIKVRDIGKKTAQGMEILENGEKRSSPSKSNSRFLFPLPTETNDKKSEKIPFEHEDVRNNWITFDDDNLNKEALPNDWVSIDEAKDILHFENFAIVKSHTNVRSVAAVCSFGKKQF